MKKRYLKSMKRWIGWILSATVIATSGNVPAVVWAEEFSSGVDNETNLLEEREANENIISDEENRDDILDQEIESETLFSDADTDSDGTEAEILEEDTLVFSAGQCSKSRQDAVNWAYAQEGKFLDYDKASGAQCVDLIKYYYAYLGVADYARGNGCDYVSNALPGGWTRIKNTADFVPEPGDIAVWGKELSVYGHVSIILSANVHSFVSMDQNWPKGSACKQVTHSYSKFWGVIRPDFSSGSAQTPTIPQGTQTISDGEYHIISALDTSKAVDVRGASKDNGANVQLYSNLSDGRNTFHVTYLGNGAYKIINSNSGRCLDVDAAGMTAGTNVQQWDYVGANQQQWIIQESGDGWFNIISKQNGLYLDVSGGNPSNETNIQVWGGNGTAGQKWRFLAWGNSTGQTVRNGDYHIVSALDGSKGLDVSNAVTDNGTNIQLYSNLSDDKQTFRVTYLGDGYYKIENTYTGKGLDMDAAGTKKGTNIQQWDYVGADQQQWVLKDAGDGYYRIISKHNGLCLDVHNGSSADGSNVQGWVWNGGAGQKWKFVENNPFGCLDGVSAAYGKISVQGWAADRDAPNTPIAVHFYAVQGNKKVLLGGTEAGQRRADVSAANPGLNEYHGFSATFNTDLRGEVKIEAYGINAGSTGSNCMLNGSPRTVTIPEDKTRPVISDVEITDISESGYTVRCKVREEGSGVDRVQFPTWFGNENPYEKDGSWVTSQAVRGKLENGKYIYRVKTSDFKNQMGIYNTHIYAWDKYGNQSEPYTIRVTVKKAHTHEYVPSVKKPATCTEPGIMLYMCKEKDDSYEKEIPATGHQHTEVRNEKPATETQDGYTGDVYCKDCNTKLSSGEVIKKTGITTVLTAAPSGSAFSGSQVKLTASADGGTGTYTYKFLICDDKGNWYKLQDYGNSNTCIWITGSAGKKMLYVDVKDSAGTVKRAELSYEVKKKAEALTAKLTADPSSSVVSGKTVKLTANANGGTGSYTYKFLVCDDKGNWYKIRDFGSINTCTWIPGVAGKKTLYVDVKDSTGTVKRAELSYEVAKKVEALTAKFTADPSSSVVSGKTVKLTASANGGTGSYTYKFLVCDDKGNWYKIRDFGSINTCTWTSGAAGKKTLYVDVKDSAGTVKRAALSYEVKNNVQPLTVKFTADPSTGITSGKQVKLTAIGNGGTGSYTYKFLICDDKENWYRIRDFGSSNTCTWTPGALGKKTLYVDVKDSSGVIIRQKLDITVK